MFSAGVEPLGVWGSPEILRARNRERTTSPAFDISEAEARWVTRNSADGHCFVIISNVAGAIPW